MSRKTSPNDIENLNQSWKYDEANGLPYSGDAVESFIKYMFGTKVGHIEFVDGALQIYDEENGTLLQSISLSGTHFAVAFASNLPTSFYVLADETSKLMTISPSTTQSEISQQPQPYTEANGYNYVVAVNSGNGYTPIDTGDEGKISDGGTASFDLRPHLATGKNYVRITVSGVDSGAVKTMVYTINLTTLSLTVNHPWQNVWNDGDAYTIRNIRFAGSLVKTLHVSIDGVELPTKTYAENISYTATSTTYEIPASAFPANRNSVHTVRLWMTAPGVTTKAYVYNIMCVTEGDTTPLVAINNVAEEVVNYTSSRLFSYAVFNADSVDFSFSSVFGGTTLPVLRPSPVSGLSPLAQYDFNYVIEINTEDVTATEGTLLVEATPFFESTEGVTMEGVTIPIDNTFSYLATPGALFYLNAATRDNGNANRETIVNEGTPDSNFAQSYPATWDTFGWMKDGWTTDEDGNKALLVPAGSSLSVQTLTPLSGFAGYPNGMTVELMFKNVYPADYDTPVITLASGNDNIGITIYPTKVKVFGSNEHSAETVQSAGFDENEIVHLTVTFVKDYGDQSGRNLCSVYINGISNVCFAFQGTSNFGTGSLHIGQDDTDVYLYKMRVYGVALESQQVFNNFLNCAIEQSMGLVRRQLYDKNNGLFFNGSIGYEQAKAAGFNIMVVEIPPQNGVDVPIPSIENSTSYSNCTMRFEYADNPNHNVTVEGLDLDGQGTTSKKYFRWNLRGKTSDSTQWTYGDGTTATGKKGKFINDGVHPLVDRITAKKNYASSPQGHKMGLTGLYNDLFMEIGLGSHLPSENYRVAVYQFPFVGFKHN